MGPDGPLERLRRLHASWRVHPTLCVQEPYFRRSGGQTEIVPAPTERLVETNGVRLRVLEAGDRGAPVVVLADGFPQLAYSWRHQIPALADAELSKDPATTLRRLMSVRTSDDQAAALRMLEPGPEGFIERIPEPGGLPAWISREEFEEYVAEFTEYGFTAPLNWCRCFDRNWELSATTPAAATTVAALFIGGSADPTLVYTSRDRAREVVSGEYREVMIEGAGHWLTLLNFLSGLELR
jgi:pimeloyl-ACP methyl ester carboxylesterase